MLEKITKRQSVRLGVAPTSRGIYPNGPAAEAKKALYQKLDEFGVPYVTLDDICPDGLLKDIHQTPKAAAYFQQEKVDALFIPFCDFGEERAAANLAKLMNIPLLIWGPRDEAPDANGLRDRDSQCGIFSATKMISRMGVPFTYITNSGTNSQTFEKGFRNFVSTAAVVKAMRNMRIGQVATRPEPFWCVMYNEAELLERFNIQVVPTTIVEIELKVRKLVEENPPRLQEAVEDLRSRFTIRMDDEALVKNAALKLVLLDWAEQEELSGIAIQCWSALNLSLGISTCFVNGELSGLGIPVACETDIHGAVSTILAQAATQGQQPAFLADLTIRHPERDDAELFWHCGNFPSALAVDDPKNCVREQFGNHYPGASDWEIKGGHMTLCRFDGIKGKYSLLMGEGEGVPGPYTRGTYVYIRFNDWPLWEHRFVYGPYIHHCAGIHGSYAPVLYEACKYIPGLSPDPVEPSKEELEDILRG